MMNQIMHQQALCSVIERALNKVLSLNLNGVDVLLPLEQKTLTLFLAELAFPLSFSVDQQAILVTTLTERCDCRLTTSIASLVELQKNQQLTELIKQDKLDITGDIKVAQQFASLFENLSIANLLSLDPLASLIPSNLSTQSQFPFESNFPIYPIGVQFDPQFGFEIDNASKSASYPEKNPVT